MVRIRRSLRGVAGGALLASMLLLMVAAAPLGLAAARGGVAPVPVVTEQGACPAGTSQLITVPITRSGPLGTREVIVSVSRDQQSATFSAGFSTDRIDFVSIETGRGSTQVDYRPEGVTNGSLSSGNGAAFTSLTFCGRFKAGFGPATGCATSPLGVAAAFNVFILGDLTQSDSDTEGRLAAGGRVTLTNYSIGAALAPAPSPDAVLVVGDALDFRGGAVATGDAISAGPATVDHVSFADGHGYRQAAALDFGAARAAMHDASAAYAALPANGTTRFEYGQLILDGADPTLNVFAVSGADLAVANSLTINVPAGATALVNVDGATAQLRNMGIALNGVGPDKVLYNFPEATALTLEGVGVAGSILAPRAAIAFTNGVIRGTLIGASLTGPGQANTAPFTGCLPAIGVSNPPPCPPQSKALILNNGSGVAGNVFPAKDAVYLTIGSNPPEATTLYLQVTDPSSRPLSPARSLTTPTEAAITLQLIQTVPFGDIADSSGEYRLKVSTSPTFESGVAPRECTTIIPFAVRPATQPSSCHLLEAALSVAGDAATEEAAVLNAGPSARRNSLAVGSTVYYRVVDPRTGAGLSAVRSVTVTRSPAGYGTFSAPLAPFADTTDSDGNYQVQVSASPDFPSGVDPAFPPRQCTLSTGFRLVDAAPATCPPLAGTFFAREGNHAVFFSKDSVALQGAQFAPGTVLYYQVTDARGRLALGDIRAVTVGADGTFRVSLAPFADSPDTTPPVPGSSGHGEYSVAVSTSPVLTQDGACTGTTGFSLIVPPPPTAASQP